MVATEPSALAMAALVAVVGAIQAPRPQAETSTYCMTMAFHEDLNQVAMIAIHERHKPIAPPPCYLLNRTGGGGTSGARRQTVPLSN